MRLQSGCVLPLLVAFIAPLLSADSFSFQGTFSTDDQVQLFNFTVSGPTNVVFRTYSYGGGTDFLGTMIPPGGFDPLLWIFQPDGSQVGSNDNDSSTFNGMTTVCDHVTMGPDGCLDSWYTNNLGLTGQYTLALLVSGNSSNGDLSTGFAETGNPNFSCAGFVPADNFCSSFSGTPLSGNWAVDIVNVTSATEVTAGVPEPAAWLLAGFGLCALAVARRAKA